jgi:hypothetical protein
MAESKKRKRTLSIDGQNFQDPLMLLQKIPAYRIAREWVAHRCGDTQKYFVQVQKKLLEDHLAFPHAPPELAQWGVVGGAEYQRWKEARERLLFAPDVCVFSVSIHGILGLTGRYRDAKLVPWLFGPEDELDCEYEEESTSCQHDHKTGQSGPPFQKNCVQIEQVMGDEESSEGKLVDELQDVMEDLLKDAFCSSVDRSGRSEDYCFRLRDDAWKTFFDQLSPEILEFEDILEYSDESESYTKDHFQYEWEFYLVPLAALRAEVENR